MSNGKMRYGKGRGLEYAWSVGKDVCPKCGEIGYIQVWYSMLGSYCFSAQHVKKGRKSKRYPKRWRTNRRCWF